MSDQISFNFKFNDTSLHHTQDTGSTTSLTISLTPRTIPHATTIRGVDVSLKYCCVDAHSCEVWFDVNTNHSHSTNLLSSAYRHRRKRKMMNTLSNVEYQMMKLSIGSSSSLASSMTCLASTCISEDYELDCSRFDAVASGGLSTSHQATEQRMAYRGSGGLSRSQCVNNLPSMGNSFPSSCSRSSRQTSFAFSGPNAGWGYFVDTPSR